MFVLFKFKFLKLSNTYKYLILGIIFFFKNHNLLILFFNYVIRSLTLTWLLWILSIYKMNNLILVLQVNIFTVFAE